MSSKIVQILDRPAHDEIVIQSKNVPTVIHVSNSSLPICQAFQPEYERLAAAEKWSAIRFCQMEFSNKTSMLFKFSPNQLPITVLMVHDNWCRTVMGADKAALESALTLLLHEGCKGSEAD